MAKSLLQIAQEALVRMAQVPHVPAQADIEHDRQPEYVKRMLKRRLARKRKAERKWSSAFGYARR